MAFNQQAYQNLIQARTPKDKKAPTPPAEKSSKMKVDLKEYKQIVTEMLAIDIKCELHTPECTGTAQGLHHMKKRGSNLLNRKYLKRACNACNGYVERHPQYAIEKGLSVSKFTKEIIQTENMTQEEILQLTCKKHIKIWKLKQLGIKPKEIALLVGTSTGSVYNELKTYENDSKRVELAEKA